jgi:hypothetical protein
VRQSSGELFTSSADATLGDCEFERRGKSPAGRGRQVAAEGHWAGIEPQTVRQDTRYVFAAISTGAVYQAPRMSRRRNRDAMFAASPISCLNGQ